jgi:hypothetical protein
VQTDLLALDLACVAGHEAGLAQLGLQGFVVLDQRAGDAQADRTGLAGGAAAGGGDDDVELFGRLGRPKNSSSGRSLTVMLPVPLRRKTRATEDLRRPVP